MRSAAALIAIVAGVTLLARVGLRLDQGESLGEALSFLTQFFTILTNTLVLVYMALVALGRRIPARIGLAVIVSIACVGILYHALLAHLVELSGLDLLADHGVHTIVPILSVVWWLVWAEKPHLSWSDPFLWVAWPLAYSAYALVRASFSGFYPYPFIDLPTLGVAGLAANMVGLVFGFVVIGGLIAGLGHLLRVARR